MSAPSPDTTDKKGLVLRLAARRQEAEGIVSFELRLPGDGPLPRFNPGDHIIVEAGPGISRAYSLCNDPTERHRYVVAVLNEPNGRGGSAAMHQLVVGDAVAVSAPRNNFALAENAKRHILLAGGIGITPLLSMAYALHREDADFVLHYGARSAARLAFRDLICASPFAARTTLHIQDDPGFPAFDVAEILGAPQAQTHVYVCGPSGFIEHVSQIARGLGWDPAQIHWEYFVAPESDGVAENDAFEIELASDGRVINVGPEETAIDALLREGAIVVTSCAEGVCGTCIVELMDGEPDHRDHYLTDEDKARGDCFMPCVSRAAKGARIKINL